MSLPASATDPLAWKPGMILLRRSGVPRSLLRRKTGDEAIPLPGWWMDYNKGGLADSIAESGEWIGLTPEVIAAIFDLADQP